MANGCSSQSAMTGARHPQRSDLVGRDAGPRRVIGRTEGAAAGPRRVAGGAGRVVAEVGSLAELSDLQQR